MVSGEFRKSYDFRYGELRGFFVLALEVAVARLRFL